MIRCFQKTNPAKNMFFFPLFLQYGLTSESLSEKSDNLIIFKRSFQQFYLGELKLEEGKL